MSLFILQTLQKFGEAAGDALTHLSQSTNAYFKNKLNTKFTKLLSPYTADKMAKYHLWPKYLANYHCLQNN